MKSFRPFSRFHHDKHPSRIIASPTGELIVSTDDGLHFWDPRSKSKQPRLNIKDFDEGAHQPILILDVSRDGKYLCTGAADLTTKVFSTETGERIARLSKPRRNYYNSAEGIGFPSGGRLLVTVMGRSAEVFRVGDWKKLHDLKGHTSKIREIDFVAGTSLLVTAAGKYVKLWDMEAGTELREWPVFSRAVADVTVSADGSLLATATEGGEVDLWDLPHAAHRLKYAAHESQVFGLAVSPDKSLVASSEFGGWLHLWSTTDGKPMVKHPLECSDTISFSPDGRYLAGTGGEEVWLLETEKGTKVGSMGSGPDLVFLDSKRLAACDGQDVVIWELSD